VKIISSKLLFVTDSKKMPNIALMKLKTWANIRGHDAGWNIHDPDYLIISAIFPKNYSNLLGVSRFYPRAQIIMGGPGLPHPCNLPIEIERLPPDYSLYPDYRNSIGYVTAGCYRNCYFCVVPKMGSFRYIQHISKFYHGGSVRLLDDNILFDEEVFKETCQWMIDNGVRGDFEYLDIRLMTEEAAGLLKEMKRVKRNIYFAYDITDRNTEELIKRNVGILENAGFHRSDFIFLMYIHSQEKGDLLDAMKRFQFLRSQNLNIFGMCNEKVTDTGLKRRVMRPAIWRGITPKEVFFP
jgi:hypothetical protein